MPRAAARSCGWDTARANNWCGGVDRIKAADLREAQIEQGRRGREGLVLLARDACGAKFRCPGARKHTVAH